ncbi:MAG: methyltransferase domain-containing protein [Rhodospirillales bacterium]|nr:methyltransferase domain-containing protein [Rhodospirillales bacterium]
MPPAAPPALDLNLMLHTARGARLGAMPPGAERMLSAGCSGLWYFEWNEKRYGRVAEHIGIEYYSAKPDGLPANVTWIANSVANMTDIADRSCDLVFSGQNIERLWPDEIAGFLLESARVLRPCGHLVIDSPSRTLTAALNWSHPEHTIELNLQEIARRAVILDEEPGDKGTLVRRPATPGAHRPGGNAGDSGAPRDQPASG